MVDVLRRMGPTLVMAAVFTWFCWPYLNGSATNTIVKPGDDVAALSKSLLSPTLQQTNDRDPFRAPKMAGRPSAGDGPAAAPAVEQRSMGPLGLLLALANAAKARSASSTAASAMPTFELGGTFIQGDRRMAIINGQVYSLGETLKEPGTEANGGKVKEISEKKVLVLWGGKAVEATAPNSAQSPAADSRGATENGAKPAPAASGGAQRTPEANAASALELLRQLQATQRP
jgi:hypothetical protein